MSQHYHAVVWIDHREAKVFHFGRDGADKRVIHPDKPSRQVHHRANSIGSGHARADHDFLHEVAQAIADAGAVLITGPATTKAELMKHMAEHDPKILKLVRAVESIDHPSDGQLLAYARKYFKADDKMHTL
jgi:stalled ribosome rescue protein Dom34